MDDVSAKGAALGVRGGLPDKSAQIIEAVGLRYRVLHKTQANLIFERLGQDGDDSASVRACDFDQREINGLIEKNPTLSGLVQEQLRTLRERAAIEPGEGG